MSDLVLESSVIEPIVVTAGILTTNVVETLPLWSATTVYAKGERVRRDTDHRIKESLTGTPHVVTIDATANTIGLPAHALIAGTKIALRSTSALPGGTAVNTIYFLVNPTTDAFQIAATLGGTAIDFTTAGGGTITAIDNPNYGIEPPDNTTTANWYDAAPTNPWALFDDLIETATTNDLLIDTTLQVSGRATGIGLFGVSGASQVRVTVNAAPGLVYDETFSMLDDDPIVDIWSYLTEEVEYRSGIVIRNLPDYADPQVRMRLSGAAAVSCGAYKLGPERVVGIAGKGAKASMDSYSRKERDQFGTPILLKRRTSKKMTLDFLLERTRAASIYRLFERLDARALVFIGSATDEPLQVYGFWRAFEEVFDEHEFIHYSATIEGMT